MRKIEREMNNAVRNKIAWSKGNSCTTFDSTIENCFVYLHGNHIATYNYADKELSLFDGGWQSNTTKSRLNALCYEFATGFSIFLSYDLKEYCLKFSSNVSQYLIT